MTAMVTRTNGRPGRPHGAGDASRRVLLLVALAFLSACSVTVGAPAPTPGPNQPTFTPIEQVHFDVTVVASPTPAPPTAPPAPLLPGATAGAGGTTKYTIKPGDTLSGIALQFGLTVDDIVRVNNIPDPNNVQAGQVLTIPAKGSTPPTVRSPSPTTTKGP